MSERIVTEYREALADCTSTWSAEGYGPVEAYHDFHSLLGEHASDYTDYLGTAITAGGYKRDVSLSYGEVVSLNTEYALDVADELHRSGAIDVHDALDAVALGKVKGWSQSDYLLFFFNMMARPLGDGRQSLDKTLEELMTKQPGFSAEVFNNESLPNNERIPHYLGFARAYWHAVGNNFDLMPISRMVELSDWNMTLGGRAEEELARQMGIRVARPCFVSYSDSLVDSPVNPFLQNKMSALQSMGADILAPARPSVLGLQDISV